jgi:hypothetical protein
MESNSLAARRLPTPSEAPGNPFWRPVMSHDLAVSALYAVAILAVAMLLGLSLGVALPH